MCLCKNYKLVIISVWLQRATDGVAKRVIYLITKIKTHIMRGKLGILNFQFPGLQMS